MSWSTIILICGDMDTINTRTCSKCNIFIPQSRGGPNHGYCSSCIDNFTIVKLGESLKEKLKARYSCPTYEYILYIYINFSRKDKLGSHIVSVETLKGLKISLFGNEGFIVPKECKNETANDDYVAFITDDKKWTAIINASGERKLIDNETKNYTITRLNGYLTTHKENGEEIFNHQTLSQVSR